jgi:hypothetical protein
LHFLDDCLTFFILADRLRQFPDIRIDSFEAFGNSEHQHRDPRALKIPDCRLGAESSGQQKIRIAGKHSFHTACHFFDPDGIKLSFRAPVELSDRRDPLWTHQTHEQLVGAKIDGNDPLRTLRTISLGRSYCVSKKNHGPKKQTRRNKHPFRKAQDQSSL